MARLILALALAAAVLAGGAATAQTDRAHVHRGAAGHAFGDAERWSKVFDDPSRDDWQKPARVIDALALPADATVADIGAGTGYFSVRLARAVPKGRVIAVDVEPAMVGHVSERARRERLDNLSATLGDAASPRLAHRVDLALVVDTYHHIDRRAKYFGDLRSMLRPGGRIAVIDFRLDSPRGPPRTARLAPETVKREMSEAGYQLVAEHDFLPDQYFLVFRPRPAR